MCSLLLFVLFVPCSLFLFMNLFFVFDDVLCSSPVFCIIVRAVCSLVLFLELAFPLFVIVFCVLVVLCVCSSLVLFCLFFVVCSLSLILSRRLLIASCWSPRKTSPILPINQSPLDVLVYCVCSLFLNLFLVVDVVLCSCSVFFIIVLVFSFCFVSLKLWFGGVCYCSLILLLERCPLFLFAVSIVVFVLFVFFVSDLVFVLKKSNEKQGTRIWNKEH